jgi:hypothetical protein
MCYHDVERCAHCCSKGFLRFSKAATSNGFEYMNWRASFGMKVC